MPVSVTVSGTSARACRRNSSDALPALPSTFTNRTAIRCAPALRAANAVSCSMKRFVSPVEARGERRLVGGGDDDRLDPGGLGRAQHVPASRAGWCRRTPPGRPPPSRRACRRRGGRSTSGRARASSASQPAAVADVAEHVRDALQRCASRARRSAISEASCPSSSVICSGRKPTSSVASARPIEPPLPVISTRRPPKRSCSSSTEGTGSRWPSTRLPVERLDRRAVAAVRGGGLRRRLLEHPLDRAVAGLHVGRAGGVGLVDLRHDEGDELAEPPDRRVELQLAAAVGQPLGEQAVRVRRRARPRALGPELLDVALELQLLVGGEPEERRVGGGEGAEQRRRARCRS